MMPTSQGTELTEAEVTRLRHAYEHYGATDGFWLILDEVTDAIVCRTNCTKHAVNLQIRKEFRQLAETDSRFEAGF